jgi:hypothetical protein
MEEYKPMCYFVTHNDFGDEQKAIFEKPDDLMKNHLKPLFIRAIVDEIGIKKVLVNDVAAVNLMPQSLLKRIGKTDKDLKPHNVILSNYEGKGWSFPWYSPSESNGGNCGQTNSVHGSPVES